MEEGTDTNTLSPRQRFCLYHGTNMPPAQVMAVAEETMDSGHLLRYGVKAKNILSAGLGPLWLKKQGVEVGTLPDLGFDSLHFSDERFALEAQSAYGAVPIRSTFLKTETDAVSMANHPAMDLLDISSEALLRLCAGFPVEAHAILKQLAPEKALSGVSASTLLDTGIRSNALSDCGIAEDTLSNTCGCSAAELRKLGY